MTRPLKSCALPRCEVDGRPAEGEAEPGVDERRHNSIVRLFSSGIGQADDQDCSIPESGMDLHFDGVSFNSIDRGGANLGQRCQVMLPVAQSSPGQV